MKKGKYAKLRRSETRDKKRRQESYTKRKRKKIMEKQKNKDNANQIVKIDK